MAFADLARFITSDMRIDHIELLARALGLLLLPGAVLAASGEEIYKTRCSLCHDSGSGQAPRISDREEWSARLARGRDALVQSAIRGVPNSAMTPRGGHADLSDAEVAAAVTYLLDRSGAKPSAAKPAPAARKPAAIVVREDSAVVADVGEALERARILGVKVESLKGEVTLRGFVADGKQAREAEALAWTVPGVRTIVNDLIPASLFEWD